jgi:benzoyl-CoA reductase/2-hydroxyglutaryl-CoA dehydratase subunit BcrC/BadD/HgdB
MVDLEKRLKDLKSRGRRLLGCFPLYPPVELLHALGLEPLVMWGLAPFIPGTRRSDQHVQDFVCSVARHLTEFVLSDAGRVLDGLVLYNACDTLRNLPEILECGLREAGRHLPSFHIHIPMAPRTQTDGSQYLRREIEALTGRLEDAFGVRLSQARFQESVALHRRARALARQLEGEVAQGKWSFTRFASVMQGNYFRPVEKQIEALATALARIKDGQEAVSEAPCVARVILSGILPPPERVSSVMEEAGLRVVGNDIASLARSYAHTPGHDASPGEYYVDFYYNHHPCTTLLGMADDRVRALEALVEERGAQGVIFLGEKQCEYESFELPYLEKRLAERGVKTLLLEFAMGGDGSLGAYRTRIEAFAEMLG